MDVLELPAITPPAGPSAQPARRDEALLGKGRLVVLAIVGVVGAQLGLRGWVAAKGWFYWDDLIVTSRAARFGLFSPRLLFPYHDGHFMPLAFAVSWLVTAIAPLRWSAAVVSLVLWQLVASVAVVRMLVVLLGRRWRVLGPLVWVLLCPLTLPAFAWWSAALNALPLQAALAWVIADALLLVRTGRRRFVVSGVIAAALGLLFFEKAVAVPFLAFGVVVSLWYVRTGRWGVRTVWRRARGLWVGLLGVVAVWAIGYLAFVGVRGSTDGRVDVGELLWKGGSAGLVAGVLGGPWRWERWLPATPMAMHPGWAVAVAGLAVGGLLVGVVRVRKRVLPVVGLLVSCLVALQLPVIAMRGGTHAPNELLESLRYFADVPVPVAAAWAIVLRARPRTAVVTGWQMRWGRWGFAGLSVAFVVSSLVTTVSFVRVWSIDPTRGYITAARHALTSVNPQNPLLDQEVPWQVLGPMAYPDNLASRVLAPIAPPGAFSTSTPSLRMLTNSGTIVPADLWGNRAIIPGPEPGCEYRITTEPTRVPLDGPMLVRDWTVQVNYVADRDAELSVGFPTGSATRVPVHSGLHTVYVRVTGGGSALQMGLDTPGRQVCVGAGPVGVASFRQ